MIPPPLVFPADDHHNWTQLRHSALTTLIHDLCCLTFVSTVMLSVVRPSVVAPQQLPMASRAMTSVTGSFVIELNYVTVNES